MESRVNISCLCGKVQETVTLDVNSSVSADVCHCNVCRWTTGSLFYSALALLTPPECHRNLSRYDSSERVSRYFCSTCGTHICHTVHRNDSWHVASGVVDHVPKDEQVSSCRPQRIAEHQFVADTVDGGLAVCLAGFHEAPARFYMQAAGGTAIESLSRGSFPRIESESGQQSQLRAACHCDGVEFFLSRPNEKSSKCYSPWPDLLRPYHSYNPDNPDDVKWWLRSGERYLAGTCACRTCRLSFSSPIACWAFIPRANLSTKDGPAPDQVKGTQKYYQSSEGRTRGFCSVCGASIFLRIDERPDLLDIALGLFRAPEGARAERWFEWVTERVSFAEEAVDKELITACESGLRHLDHNGK